MTTAVATKPLPPHGTTARAKGRADRGIPRCPCGHCRGAERRYAKRRNYDNATGRPRLVDPAPAAEHLRQLRARGAGWKLMAVAATCSLASIHALLHGRTSPIHRGLSERILSIRLDQVISPGHVVRADGSARRIRALIAIGHEVQAIAAATPGVGKTLITQLALGRVTTLRADRAQRIADAYRVLAMRPGPSVKSRRRAAQQGWPGPMAWGSNIDDPAALPDLTVPEPDISFDGIDPIAVLRVLNGESTALTRPEQITVARILHAERGLAMKATADRLGVTDRTVLRWKQAGWAAGP